MPLTLQLMLAVLSLPASPALADKGGKPSPKAAAIPFVLSNNLIILPCRVNGSKPLSFLLDTGASASVINEGCAKQLGLKTQGQAQATTGGGQVAVSFVHGVTLSLSETRLPGVTLAAIDLSGLEAGHGQNVDGVLGYDVFSRFAVEIDYAARMVRFHEPTSYRYSGSGEALSITVEDNTPFVHATVVQPGVKPVEGKFEFDTGQVGALTLTGPFTKKNGLLPPTQKTLQTTSGAILAGRSNAGIGRVARLQLGRFAVNNPVANFSRDTQGDGASADDAGLIGGELLRRFKVIIDYSRRQVILEPNRRFAEPYEFDMSGMSLTAEGPEFRVYRVRTLIPESPAAEAGLLAGDVITAINGKPAARLTLTQIRQMFRRDGQEYRLSIQRGEITLQVRLKTRRLI